MTIIKTLQSFLLPSSFIFLFLVAGLIILTFSKKKKHGKVFIIIGTLSYFLLSITPVSDLLLQPLEVRYTSLTIEEMDRADKMVLLLGGRESNVLRSSEVLRIWHLSESPLKIVISGTDPLIEASEEAQAVRNFFIHRGIAPENIIIEGKSKDTWENVANVKKIVEDKEFFLVTSAYHMNRSLSEFERLGANPIPAPTDFKRKTKSSYVFFDFFPNVYNLRNSDLALHEHLGSAYYRIRWLKN